MPAWRIGAFWPRSQPVDEAALAPPGAPRAEPGPDTIARHRKRQEDRLAPVLSDAIASSAEALDRQLDKLLGRQLLLLTIISDRFAGRSGLLAKRETRILTQ